MCLFRTQILYVSVLLLFYLVHSHPSPSFFHHYPLQAHTLEKKEEEAEGIQIFVQCQSQDSFMVTVVLVLSKFIRHVTLSANVCV